MRISDWSSDVCSSDLVGKGWDADGRGLAGRKPLQLVNAFLNGALVRAGRRTLLDQQFLGNTGIDPRAGWKRKSINDGAHASIRCHTPSDAAGGRMTTKATTSKSLIPANSHFRASSEKSRVGKESVRKGQSRW